MAEVVNVIIKTLNETNGTDTESDSKPATTEGLWIAYASLQIMASVAIYIGSLRSVERPINKKMKKKIPETPEFMTEKTATMAPVITSGTLITLYIIFRTLSKEHIDLGLTLYSYVLGQLSLINILISNKFTLMLPKSIPKTTYQLQFTEGTGKTKYNWINAKFTLRGALCFVLCLIVGAFYIHSKHWIISNIFGLAIAIKGIEMLRTDTFKTGCILLCGLFVYDIFWVFGTNVMVTLAKSFDASIKIVFPVDLLENGILAANKFSMLGLGDIIIPGILIAFMLRFDHSLKRKTKTYFNATFLAYFLGLLTTALVMHVFNAHSQPALLYLVPACLITPILVALVCGDLKTLFRFGVQKTVQEKSSKKLKIN